MKVLITGGAGYLGYDLVTALDKHPQIEEITVFDNLYRENSNFFLTGTHLLKTKFIKGDILDIYQLERAVKNQDIIIHLAAHVDFPYTYKDNYKYEQVNQYGTGVLYNLLEKYCPQKLIYLSSAAVYGFKNVSSESTLPEPSNFYGISKLQGEKYMQLMQDQSEVFILRSANVFGFNPMVRLDSVINTFLFDALLYNKIKIHGNGKQKRPFIYLPKLVDKIVEVTTTNFLKPGVYNLVEENCSLNELRDRLMQFLPDLEFTYIDSSSSIPSLEMSSVKLNVENDFANSFLMAYKSFNQALRLRSLHTEV